MYVETRSKNAYVEIQGRSTIRTVQCKHLAEKNM